MDYGYGNWLMVGISVILTLYFVKSVFKPRTKTDWTTFRTFGAFIVALFTEMYGFPLTIYLLSPILGSRLGLDFTHNNGHILNTLLGFKGDPHFSPLHILSYIFIFGGLMLIERAWSTLYESIKQAKLAVTGIYRYVRHPQYIGFSLIIIGFLLQWPTIITVFMAPFLLWRYWRLSKLEEKEMEISFKNNYLEYKNHTQAFISTLSGIVSAFKTKKSPKSTFIKS